MVRFFTFASFHNKRPSPGSTVIRVDNLLKYWPEAGIYTYGENPDTLIFQKVYNSQDYKFITHFKGMKILDICDPDWMSGFPTIKETVDGVDAVVCPTKAIADFLGQMTHKPIHIIKDRFDLALVPEPKRHTRPAETVVWFGYSHNAELIKPVLPLIEKHGLKLLIIADDNPIPSRWCHAPSTSLYIENNYRYLKYEEETIYDNLQRADFAVLPKGFRPQDSFKSENKTIKANLAGLPVAYDLESFEYYLKAENRQSFVAAELKNIRADYDVRKSVEEYKELISCLAETKTKV